MSNQSSGRGGFVARAQTGLGIGAGLAVVVAVSTLAASALGPAPTSRRTPLARIALGGVGPPAPGAALPQAGVNQRTQVTIVAPSEPVIQNQPAQPVEPAQDSGPSGDASSSPGSGDSPGPTPSAPDG